MTADVNVTEKVARAIDASPNGRWLTLPGPVHLHRQIAHAALSALSDPEVLAGMAGVLVREIYPAHDPDECCDEWQRDHAERVATALADWLRGGA